MAPPRMRPFKSLASVDEALAALLAAVTPVTDVERVPLSEAAGRVLAEDVASPLDVPGFDRSAMDGFAVRAADTVGAAEDAPVTLRVVAVVHAGAPTSSAVADGEAARIATGGRVPEGADAVVPVEETAADAEDAVRVLAEARAGAHVSRRGADVREGDVVLRAGMDLTPARVGVAASLGRAALDVYRRPRVTVITTGDEVVEPGEPLAAGHIYNSNAFALEALFRGAGAAVERAPVAGDTVDALERALDGPGQGADLVVFTGGSSVGERDVLVDLAAKRGEVLVHGVRVKPGKPVLVAKAGAQVILGLPGNPASCLVTGHVFGVPAIHAIARRPRGPGRMTRARLGEAVASRSGRYQLMPVRLDAEGRAWPTFKESGHTTSLAGSDGYVGLAEDAGELAAGTDVEVRLW